MKIVNFSTAVLLFSPTFALAQSSNAAALKILRQAGAAITLLVKADSRLTPEFLRMGFHDCVGGCDGCIDLADPNNSGLAHPIAVLAPAVAQFENKTVGVSRADIWALAAMVGASVAKVGGAQVNFTQNWFGRLNCEDANSICTDPAGAAVTCTATTGPGRILPPPDLDSNGVFSFFNRNFGFTERQTVAIMGAHTVGRAVRTESGIDAPNGWTVDNVHLQNEYYMALMGGNIPSSPVSSVSANSPNWTRFALNNTGIGAPDRNYWTLDVAGTNVVMLSTDIALVRNLSKADNMNPSTGAVSCKFAGSDIPCPIRSPTWQDAAAFAADNKMWLTEFRAAFDLLLTNGYNRLQCASAVCPLINTRIMPTQPGGTSAPTQMPVMTVYTPPPISGATSAPTQAPVQTLYTPAPTQMPVQTLYTPAPTQVPVQIQYTPPPTSSPTKKPLKPPTPMPNIYMTPQTTPVNPPQTPPPTRRPTFLPTRLPTRPPTFPPTRPPTVPPVAPTPQPNIYMTQTAPVAPPIQTNQVIAPVQSPTPPPTPSPTPPPTPSPTAPAIPGCCSQDGATCITWGGNTPQQCNAGQNLWLLSLPPKDSCTTRWNACTHNETSCCAGLVCVGDQWWKGCQFILGASTPPSAMPTAAPTPQPTPSPTTPPPTQPPTLLPTAPPTISGCCSQDGATCITWGGNTPDVCNAGQNLWLPKGAVTPPLTCTTRWNGCTNNVNACCPGLVCTGDQWSKSCQLILGASTPPSALPTTQPTKQPTTAPTKKPTPPPTKQPASAPPTKQPETAPIPPVTTSAACCSQMANANSCITWGGSTKSQCNAGNNPWLPYGPPNYTCVARWASCLNNVNSCCPGLVCQGDQWSKSCQYVSGAVPGY